MSPRSQFDPYTALDPYAMMARVKDTNYKLYLIDLVEGKDIDVIGDLGKSCGSVAISPDGRLGLSIDDAGMCLWEINSRMEQPLWQTDEASGCAVFSADGRSIYAQSGKDILIWDAYTGRLKGKIALGEAIGPSALAVDPNGQTLVIAFGQELLALWDLDRQDFILRIDPPATIITMAIHPGGRWLATGGYDNLVRIWDFSPEGIDATTLEPAAVLSGHAKTITSLAFAPDGCYLLSGSGVEQALRLWYLDWSYEYPPAQDWHPGAQPYLETFLRRAEASNPTWLQNGWAVLWETLIQVGYGWLRPEGVRRKLEEMAAERG